MTADSHISDGQFLWSKPTLREDAGEDVMWADDAIGPRLDWNGGELPQSASSHCRPACKYLSKTKPGDSIEVVDDEAKYRMLSFACCMIGQQTLS
ncbi:hypothetical protein CIB48_g2639 [Xylaria polymorpha]|nr:hypothetical protein CIB48_g2639 [Xylaria polymorpha]